MSQSKKKNPTEDLMESLMADLNLNDSEDAPGNDDKTTIAPFEEESTDFGLLDLNLNGHAPALESIKDISSPDAGFEIKLADVPSIEDASETLVQSSEPESIPVPEVDSAIIEQPLHELNIELNSELNNEKTVALTLVHSKEEFTEADRTVAVAGYSNRRQAIDNDVKISVGQSGGSGYGGWGSTDSNLAQAENLKMAQSKILDLEKENEKLRHQNQELISASEIIKERSDLLTAQIYEYKNDREGLENSFKNEMALLKSQLNRKDAEMQKAQMKIEELESRLKFDMKKIRIRERELENRLELIRAEKNALVRNKDEQILDARRKMDQLQLEVDSYRQKCVELNRALETNQDSFKRTTRALRLAMANLELQEENKTPIKKVD